MKISIHPEVFERFPGFSRGVIVANGIRNPEQNTVLEADLRIAEDHIRSDPSTRDVRNIPRVKAWLDTFTQLGLDPTRTVPSVANLMKRVANGGRTKFISTAVALLNIHSLRARVPAGGDDLASICGDLCLRQATGSEVYIPLGQPDRREPVPPGEIVYVDSAGQVLCRAWCWRNSHVTRIQPTTSTLAINVDALAIVGPQEARKIAEDLAADVREYCGGSVKTFLLHQECPEAEITIT